MDTEVTHQARLSTSIPPLLLLRRQESKIRLLSARRRRFWLWAGILESARLLRLTMHWLLPA